MPQQVHSQLVYAPQMPTHPHMVNSPYSSAFAAPPNTPVTPANAFSPAMPINGQMMLNHAHMVNSPYSSAFAAPPNTPVTPANAFSPAMPISGGFRAPGALPGQEPPSPMNPFLELEKGASNAFTYASGSPFGPPSLYPPSPVTQPLIGARMPQQPTQDTPASPKTGPGFQAAPAFDPFADLS